MKAIQRTFQRLYEDGLKDNWDRVCLVIGDEGVGKSTFMITATIIWHDILGRPVDAETILNQVAWGERRALYQAFTERQDMSIIPVQDAARALHNLEVQMADQRELQKAFLDIRVKNHLFLLGFQSWDDIPRFLKKRRAKNAFVVPRRGYVRGYNREAMDEKYETQSWPEPQLRSSFPSLEGLEVWEEFVRRDREAKIERIEGADDSDPVDVEKKTNIKTVLRMVKPWDDSAGMSQREAAKYIDYSRTWVGDRVEEWNEGYYRDILPEDEMKAHESAAVG